MAATTKILNNKWMEAALKRVIFLIVLYKSIS
jgi:hypothetical protein